MPRQAPPAATTDPGPAELPWRRLHPQMMLVHPVTEVGRFLPFVIGLVILGRSSDGGEPVSWRLLGVLVPIVVGLMRYATTRFRITETQLELRRGLVSRSTLTAPLDRVRTVELTSPLIHRLLGLSRVRIGTGSSATTGEDGLELNALGAREAQHLRERLLHRVAPVEVTLAPGELPDPTTYAVPTREPDRVVLRLDPTWARYAPLTTSGLVLAAGLLAASSQLLGEALLRVAESSGAGPIRSLPVPVVVILAIVVGLAVVSTMSVVGYLVGNWGFTLSEDARGRSLQVRRGLVTTNETSLERARVRGVELHQPLGLRLAGAARVNAAVTGLARDSGGSTVVAPPSPLAVARGVGEVLLGEGGPLAVPLVPHGPVARRRRYVRAVLGLALLPIAVAALGLPVGLPWWVVVMTALVVPMALPLARDRYARLGHALTHDHLVVQSGTLSGSRVALQRDGVIGWTISQTFFQRRAGIVALTATTAAGAQHYSALDVPEHLAVALADAATPGLLTPFLAITSAGSR